MVIRIEILSDEGILYNMGWWYIRDVGVGYCVIVKFIG